MDTATIDTDDRRSEDFRSDPPTPAEARVRQREVSSVGLLVLGAVVAASVRADVLAPETSTRALVDPGALRALSLLIAVGFLAYAIQQDRRIRALEVRHGLVPTGASAGVEAAVIGSHTGPGLTLRLHDACLLGDVVAALLDDARELTAAFGVELRLHGFDGRTRAAGRVGRCGVPTRTVPLEHRGRPLGELAVCGPIRCSEAQLRALAALGAVALVRARGHEHTLNVLGELRDALAAQPRTITLVG